MQRSILHFPKRLFWNFISRQLIVSLVVFGVGIIFYRFYINETLKAHSVSVELRQLIDRSFLIFGALFSMLFTSVSVWMGRRLVFPLGRLIVKAGQILRKEQQDPESEELFEADELGEWSELSIQLDKIKKNLTKQSERISRENEEMTALMSTLADPILAVDEGGQAIFFNSKFRILFATDQKPSAQFSIEEVFRSPEILDVFYDVLKNATPLTKDVQIFIESEGAAKHFSLSVAPLKKHSAHIVYGAVGIFHDVTELKKMERMRIEFVENVSHELRTPLTSIAGYSMTLKEDIKSGNIADADRHISTILRNTDRLTNLVSDLLNLSSLEAGTEIHRNKILPQELTQNVLQQVRTKWPQADRQLKMQVGIQHFIGDPVRVEQVLVNLVENAFKYVPADKGIEIIWEKDHNGDAVLRVKDHGPGIPQEHLPRLFERFYRVDKARSRETGGTGLGLAIVKHIMQRHGGSVLVKSEPGHGAEFICRFPQ